MSPTSVTEYYITSIQVRQLIKDLLLAQHSHEPLAAFIIADWKFVFFCCCKISFVELKANISETKYWVCFENITTPTL